MFRTESNGLEVRTKRFFLCVAKVTDRKNAEVIGFQYIARRSEDIFSNNFNIRDKDFFLSLLNKTWLPYPKDMGSHINQNLYFKFSLLIRHSSWLSNLLNF